MAVSKVVDEAIAAAWAHQQRADKATLLAEAVAPIGPVAAARAARSQLLADRELDVARQARNDRLEIGDELRTFETDLGQLRPGATLTPLRVTSQETRDKYRAVLDSKIRNASVADDGAAVIRLRRERLLT